MFLGKRLKRFKIMSNKMSKKKELRREYIMNPNEAINEAI